MLMFGIRGVVAMLVTLLALTTQGQAPPVDDESGGGAPIATIAADGVLTPIQRSLADLALTGDLGAIYPHLEYAITHGLITNGDSELVGRTLGAWPTMVRSSLGGSGTRNAAATMILAEYDKQVGQTVTLRLLNGTTRTVMLDRLSPKIPILQWEQPSYVLPDRAGKQIIRLSLYDLHPSMQLELLEKHGRRAPPILKAAAHFSLGELETGMALIEKDRYILSRLIRARRAELAEAPEHKIPRLFITRTPQAQATIAEAAGLGENGPAVVEAYLKAHRDTQYQNGAWSSTTTTTNPMTALAYLANGHFPGSTVHGDAVAIYARRGLHQVLYERPELAGLVAIESYALSGQPAYRDLAELALTSALALQGEDGLLIGSDQKPNLTITSYAVQLFFIAALCDVRREECLAALAKLRQGFQRRYDRRAKALKIRDLTYNTKVGLDDAHALVILRFLGDYDHPLREHAVDRVQEATTADPLRMIIMPRYGGGQLLRPPFAEAVSFIGPRTQKAYVKTAGQQVLLGLSPHGAWPNLHPHDWPHASLAISGLWRFDWDEVDRIAAAFKQ